MKPHLIIPAALLGLALATAACDSRAQESGGAPLTLQSPAVLRSDTTQSLMRRICKSPWDVAFQGVRRIEQHWQVDTTSYSLVYREQVSADGNGRFAVDPLELIEPQVSLMEQTIFAQLQKAREGFLYRYRDFHIHDEVRFARYYSAVASGTTTTVAGRDCQELAIQRRTDARIVYELAVDSETGLVLRCRQVLPDGTLIGSMEFESVSYALDPFQIEWHQSANEEEDLARGARAQQQLGFAPMLPSGDGGSFTLLESTKLSSPAPAGGTQTWAKYTLTDGVEVVFFLDGGPDPASVDGDVMRLSPSVGPWNHVEGSLHGERLMGMGRVSSDELLDLLDSVF